MTNTELFRAVEGYLDAIDEKDRPLLEMDTDGEVALHFRFKVPIVVSEGQDPEIMYEIAKLAAVDQLEVWAEALA